MEPIIIAFFILLIVVVFAYYLKAPWILIIFGFLVASTPSVILLTSQCEGSDCAGMIVFYFLQYIAIPVGACIVIAGAIWQALYIKKQVDKKTRR